MKQEKHPEVTDMSEYAKQDIEVIFKKTIYQKIRFFILSLFMDKCKIKV